MCRSCIMRMRAREEMPEGGVGPGEMNQYFTDQTLADDCIIELTLNSTKNIICCVTTNCKVLFYSIQRKEQKVDYFKLLAAPRFEHHDDEDDEGEQEGDDKENSQMNKKQKQEEEGEEEEKEPEKKHHEFACDLLKEINLSKKTDKLCTCCFTPDSKFCLVGAGEAKIFVIDMISKIKVVKEIVNPHVGADAQCNSIDVNDNSSLVVAAFRKHRAPKSDGRSSPLVIYDIQSFFTEQDEFINHVPPTTRVFFSPSVTQNAIGSVSASGEANYIFNAAVEHRQNVVVTDIDTGDRWRISHRATESVDDAAFNGDGTRIITAASEAHAPARIFVFDISDDSLIPSAHESEDAFREDNNNRAAGAPLLFCFGSGQTELLRFRVCGRHTLMLFDRNGYYYSMSLSDYKIDNGDKIQTGKLLSRKGAFMSSRAAEANAKKKINRTVLSNPDPKYLSGGRNFACLLDQEEDEMTFIAATALSNSSFGMQKRNNLVTIVGVRKMSNWNAKRAIFLVREFGKSSIAQLLQKEWVPLYLSSQFL